MSNVLSRISRGQTTVDFLGNRKRWYAISAVVVVFCLAALLIRGLTLGIEFTGGADFQSSAQVTKTTVDDVRQAVLDSGVDNMRDLQVTTMGDSTVRVQTRTLNVDEVVKVRGAIAKQVGGDAQQVTYNLIGASWGKSITQKGVLALVVFLALVMIMITVYFRNWKYSVAAIVAVLHDLVVTVGVYALVGFSVTPATLIGVLTILGYSLYDTMVVFDKTRENTKDVTQSQHTFTYQANVALNQVLVRSINTTVIAILPVVAILFAGVFVLGTGPLKDLSLALAVGMIAGTYSSIFIATSLLVEMTERTPVMVQHRERLERRRARAEQRSRVKTARVAEEADEQAQLAAVTVQTVEEPVEAPVVDTRSRLSDGERRQPRHLPRSKRKKQ